MSDIFRGFLQTPVSSMSCIKDSMEATFKSSEYGIGMNCLFELLATAGSRPSILLMSGQRKLASISPTFIPFFARATAKFTITLVLPTPPLKWYITGTDMSLSHLPGATTGVMLSFFRYGIKLHSFFFGVTGLAPGSNALLYISPSVPLSPTLPPIPATGLTINPILRFISLPPCECFYFVSWRAILFFDRRV